MANEEHLAILRKGVKVWDRWRVDNPDIQPDLSNASFNGYEFHGDWVWRSGGAFRRGANLNGAIITDANLSNVSLSCSWLGGAALCRSNFRGADLQETELSQADLSGADLRAASLRKAYLFRANLQNSNLEGVDLSEALLQGADFRGANLRRAKLRNTFVYRANMSGADLTEADLTHSHLVETDLRDSVLSQCRIYGTSAWQLNLTGAIQTNLVVTRDDEPIITIDNLEAAQFIHLLIVNDKIREIVNTITTKVVLILGRFTPERKLILEAIRDVIRRHNYLPVLFDFDKPTTRNLTETVTTLAHMSRFIIADITDPRSIPQELAFIVPDLPSVPVLPVLHILGDEYGMFEHFRRFPWVMDIVRYTDVTNLVALLENAMIAIAEMKAKSLTSGGIVLPRA